MNRFNKRVYEMLNRIVVFAVTYPDLFGKDTLPLSCLRRFGQQSRLCPGMSCRRLRAWGRSGEAQSPAVKRGAC